MEAVIAIIIILNRNLILTVYTSAHTAESPLYLDYVRVYRLKTLRVAHYYANRGRK